MNNSGNQELSDNNYNSINTLPFFFTGLLLLIGVFSPSYSAWGFNIWEEYNHTSASLIIIFSLVVTLLIGYKPVQNNVNNLIESLINFSDKIHKVIVSLIISTGFLWLFIALRSKALIYGDGYSMVDSFTAALGTELVGQEKLQSLSIYFYRWVSSIIINNFDTTPELTIGIINAIGGLIGFWGVYFLSKILTDNNTSKFILFFILLSSGATLLFFGHIENYTWPVALSLWTLYFAIGVLKDKNSVIPMFLFALLAAAWHIIFINTLVLSVLAVIIKKYNNLNGLFKFQDRYLKILAAAGLFIIIALNQFINFKITMGYSWIFVQVWPSPNNNYWFFSPAHLLDIFNLLFFLMPSGIMIIIFLIFTKKFRLDNPDTISTLLGWFALVIFLEMFWIDPLIGASRDWDLLAFAGFPLSAWAGYKFIKSIHHYKKQEFLVLSAGIVLLLHIGPHVYEKHHLEIAASRLDRLVWNCPHYQADFDLAYRCLSWGAILASRVGRPDLAQRYFRRRIEAAPDSNATAVAWFGIGEYFAEAKQNDSAVVYLRHAAALKPKNIGYLYDLGMIYSELRMCERAVATAEYLTTLDPENDRTLFGASTLLIKCNKPKLARAVLKKAYALNAQSWDVAANIGVTFIQTQQPDSVIYWSLRAIDLNPSVPFLYENIITAYVSLNQWSNARHIFDQYKMMETDLNKIKRIEQMLINP